MKSDRGIALNYLGRFKKEIDGCLYCIDKDEEPKIYDGVVEEVKAIETTIKLIKELEVE